MIALVAAYYVLAGSTAWRTSFGIRIATIYEAGAIIALWMGGRPIGTLHPVSLRPIFVGLGFLLMLASFVVMLTTRDFARGLEFGRPNKPAAGKAGVERAPAVGHHWPGLPEPGRSADAAEES